MKSKSKLDSVISKSVTKFKKKEIFLFDCVLFFLFFSSDEYLYSLVYDRGIDYFDKRSIRLEVI